MSARANRREFIAILGGAASACPPARYFGLGGITLAAGLGERMGGFPADTPRTQARKANHPLPNIL